MSVISFLVLCYHRLVCKQCDLHLYNVTHIICEFLTYWLCFSIIYLITNMWSVVNFSILILWYDNTYSDGNESPINSSEYVCSLLCITRDKILYLVFNNEIEFNVLNSIKRSNQTYWLLSVLPNLMLLLPVPLYSMLYSPHSLPH